MVLELGRWGSREPPNDGPLGPDAAVIALMTMFHGELEGTFELRLDGHAFRVQAADGRLDAGRGPATDADAVIEGDPGTLASVLWHDADPGRLAVSGDRRAARRFLRAFSHRGRRG